MPDKYLIGVDIGTQGTKTSLFDLSGRSVAESFEPSRLISPAPGAVEQDADEIYSSVLNTIREVVGKAGVKPGEVAAIGLDGQMAGIMGIDEDWNAVTPYDSWLDTRCEKYIRQIKQKAEDLVVKTTGCPVSYAHGPKILWWKHERPEAYERVSKFVLPGAYVAGRLSGLKAADAYIDYTHLHFSGYGDVYNNKWSEELLDIFDVERDKMPDIVEPWKVIGGLTGEAAQKSGLLEGTAVVAGCGDTAANSLGVGVTESGIAFDVAGTASVFSCCVDSYNPDVKYKTLLYPRSVIPGLWAPMAYINGGGLCIRWFKDNLTGSAKASYEELENEAEKLPPGSEGLVFLPHFGGRMCPNNPNVRGTYIGLTWTHGRGHMYRAILEGIAYEYGIYLRILKELQGEVSFAHVLAIGGGAKSRLFNSIKADVLGIPYVTLKTADTATLGCAVIAGYGVGLYGDIKKTIDAMIEKIDRIEPDIHNNMKYKAYSRVYEGLFDALGSSYAQLQEAGR